MNHVNDKEEASLEGGFEPVRGSLLVAKMTFKWVSHRKTHILEKWSVVVCTHIGEHPSPRGLLLCNSAIIILHFNHVIFPGWTYSLLENLNDVHGSL